MRKPFLLLPLLALSLPACGGSTPTSSSSESSSEEQLTPFVGNDVKDYLSFLNTAEHYALSIDVDGEVYYSLS